MTKEDRNIGKTRENDNSSEQRRRDIGYTYYRWRREYGGLNIDQAKELKKLKKENEKLKKAIAELTLDKLILNEALSGKY